MQRATIILITAILLTTTFIWAADDSVPPKTLWLDELDITKSETGWGTPQRNRSVDGNSLQIGGRTFDRGLGTHAQASLRILLPEGVEVFQGFVGVDDEVGTNPASIEFRVYGDDLLLWKSSIMKSGDEAKSVKINIAKIRKYRKPIQSLTLLASGANDGINFDHADWADAYFLYTGEPPKVLLPIVLEPYILTPPAPPAPRINGPRIFGARPGHPFLFTIPATGDRPMTFAAKDLPDGLSLDPKTGQISGTVKKTGSYSATLSAKNAKGQTERELRIEIGDRIALTPPLGWNSWNCWAGAVDAEKVMASAQALVDTGLINHGWSYINIDDTWQAARGGEFHAIQGNEKFPDMKKLCDDVHNMGLKIGIYSTPWMTSYANYIGGASDNAEGTWTRNVRRAHGKYPFATNDAKQWAAWGFDYLKYDWNPNDVPHVDEMAKALRASGRDVVYSLSNSAPFKLAHEWERLAHCWRTTGDIVDTWSSMAQIGFSQDRWSEFGGPGHWNDPDMLVVGKVGWGPALHPTRLSPDEQYTHISLWSLLAAPLLLGCDLTDMDPFTLSLLTNDEVLEVNQDPLGDQANQTLTKDEIQVWTKAMEDGSTAIGLFNLGPVRLDAEIKWAELNMKTPTRIRDLWRQKDVKQKAEILTAQIPTHGVLLLRTWPEKE